MGHVALIRDWRGAYRILVGKAEGNISLGRMSLGWEDNIKINF